MDMDLGQVERGDWARRCIQRGDMLDEIQEIGPTAGRGQAFAALPPRDGKEGRYATVSHASSTLRRHPPLQTIVTIR